MTQHHEVTMKGAPRAVSQIYSDVSEALEIKGDFIYGGVPFRNTPLKTLHFRKDEPVEVVHHPTGLPFLLDIRDFREALIPVLEDRVRYFERGGHPLSAAGTQWYINWLGGFKDELCIVRQAKHILKGAGKAPAWDESQLSSIVKLFGEAPYNNNYRMLFGQACYLAELLNEQRFEDVIQARKLLASIDRIPSTDVKLIRV